MALGGRIDHPPAAIDRVRLPADIGRRFLVFVDTEEEFDWAAPRRREAPATETIAAVPGAHRRLAAFGVRPIYLLDYPVAADPRAIGHLAPLLASGEAEIGAQLHPWVNPPHDEPLTERNSFVGNLPEALEQAKIRALTDRLTAGFGRRPIVYRAGRYGIGPHSARLLEAEGYRLDCSARALFDYSDEGGPDFSGRDAWPHWAGPARLLLELPLTSVFGGRLRRHGARLYRRADAVPRGRGLLARTGLLQRLPLTPEGTPLADACLAIRLALEEGLQLLSISFHSPSLVPGHTPYVRDAADLRRFYAWWDGVLDLLAREGVQPISAEALLAAAWRARATGLPLASAGPA
ncbi:polysaccharide deacetylase family protein [Sphingomonas morindae]|uniref:Polysaccharide deacetylase family protein n=1 Tax=Sphingomonas morindae TaxID=1541170 RepID=A0ABY4X7Q6_9SPHN|nr:polysaccharide deacetylase family protein [Sphingomonas morindae]USI72973.1 polysaccharide deacetylase family protein [Sphingomonas morindae]